MNSEINREYVKDQRQVVSYKSKLDYTQACKELSKILGEDWKKKETSAEEDDLTITIAQVHSSVSGSNFPYFITLTLGPIPAEQNASPAVSHSSSDDEERSSFQKV